MKYLLLLSIIAAASCSTPTEPPPRRNDEQIESFKWHLEHQQRMDSIIRDYSYRVGYLRGRCDATVERLATKCKCRCHQH